MTSFVLVWVSALAMTSAPEVETQDLRLRASALAGADSNLRQSARSEGWSAAAVTQVAGSARFLVGEDVAGLGGEAVFDLGEGADRAHRITLVVEGLWSRFIFGRRRAFGLGPKSPGPSLRMDLRSFYRTGLRLDRWPESREEIPVERDEEEDETDGELLELGPVEGGPPLAFLDPFHDVGAVLDFRYRPRRRTRLRLRGRLRRSWRGSEPEEPTRHFAEVAGRLGWRERLHPSLVLVLRYELGARTFDERTDGHGGRLLYVVHRPQTELRGRWRRLRGRLGYGLRVLEANRDGRSRVRHEGSLEARYGVDSRWEWLARLDLATEVRLGRPARNWDRLRVMLGVAVAL